MNVKLKATKIKWNVNKEDIEESSSLPNEIDVPEKIVNEAMNKILLEMSDYISDETGFCHNGFALKMLFENKGGICMNSEEKIKIEFNKKIQSEVEEFRKRMTNESSEYVYSAYEKVCFIETLYDMLFCTNIASDAKENISFDAIKWLNDKEKPLEFLYQKFTKEQYVFSKNWDDLIDVIECLYFFEENERLKSQLKEQEAIRELAEGCIYDIEDALYRGNKNDWASEAIDEFEEKVKELKGE